MVSIRYIVNGISQSKQKFTDGDRKVYGITLVPDPEDPSFANGTQLGVSLFSDHDLNVDDKVTLSLTKIDG